MEQVFDISKNYADLLPIRVQSEQAYHIVAVVKNAEILAEKYRADKEVVLIAAWLHDIASITDYSLYDLHHIHGAEMAYSILKEYGYASKKIRMVQECIKNHREGVV